MNLLDLSKWVRARGVKLYVEYAHGRFQVQAKWGFLPVRKHSCFSVKLEDAIKEVMDKVEQEMITVVEP